eukprot:SAG22_NODE_51_length_24458_cov_19.853161_9_plen_526_part_00
MAALAASLLLLGASGAAGQAGLKTPPWDYVPAATGSACVDATSDTPAGVSGRGRRKLQNHGGNNARWVYYAVPEGTPPAAGWPVWLSLVTDNFDKPPDAAPSSPCSSGGGGYSRGKPFGAFATPNETMTTCFEASPPPPLLVAGVEVEVEVEGPFCGLELRRYCAAAEKQGATACLGCAGQHAAQLQKACTEAQLSELCNHTRPGPSPPGPSPPSPSPWPPHHRSSCDYDQQAGALWNQRLKQFLLANGVAVVVVNPFTEDSWDAGPWWWGTSIGGGDQPFFAKLFPLIAAGKFGKLDLKRTVVRGWSGGAQMVSWLMQVAASNATAFPDMQIKGGVMLSGGSYECYNDPQDPTLQPPPQPVGSCASCTEGGPSHCDSTADPKCDSCTAGVKTYCQQCCPKNFTEQHFHDKPAAYSEHPPVFLAQTSKSDNHADLCACKNYYNTLLANGVKGSQLVLMPAKDEKCFCIGNSAEPTAAGSPYSHYCDAEWGGSQCGVMGGNHCCIGHTLGFASMVEPATKWALSVL